VIHKYILLAVGIIMLISVTPWAFKIPFETGSWVLPVIICSIAIGVLIAGIVVAWKQPKPREGNCHDLE